ncbi:MAG: UbiD family decarboxylase [Deltaproteobacteria bacterium]|nr:UbiD family decarboxylase [Deltaproteobacteria bacterium]
MTPDLRTFLGECDAAGLLDRVARPTAPGGELARRLAEAGERTVWFERVVGHRVPVVAGVCASRAALARALDTTPPRLVHTVAAAIDGARPWRSTLDAPFRAHVVRRPDLGRVVPVVEFYPSQRRRYLTGTIVVARRPGGVNLSFHRMMLLGGNRLAVRIVPRHLHALLAEQEGRAEVAVVCGVHPAVEIAASVSGDPALDELRVAAALLRGRLACTDLDGFAVPAHAELVLRGRFTGALADEGPFVDLTGTADGVRRQPVLVVDRLYHRDDWLYRTILPGGAEHKALMGIPQEPRILRIVANAVPGVAGVALTPGGCSWLHAVVAIRVRADGDGRNAGLAALAAHPSLKRVVVVDDDIDPADAQAVEWAVATRCRPDRDLFVIPHARGSSLDPSRDPETETTAKWIVDATIPFGRPRGEFLRVQPDEPARKPVPRGTRPRTPRRPR